VLSVITIGGLTVAYSARPGRLRDLPVLRARAALGVILVTLPIGGADMPVVISL
jgi:NAD/NADP transhydrogenase beta subunit